jgi:hypothetical protein
MKKVPHTRTSYNFMQDHSEPIEHKVNERKIAARMNESGSIIFPGKTEPADEVIE